MSLMIATVDENEINCINIADTIMMFLPPHFPLNQLQQSHLIIPPEILNNPLFNKSSAFKSGERDRLRFRGLLPPRVTNMQIQKERVLQEIRVEESMIRKHVILEDLHDTNETLYHRILVDHMEEMAPIIYTPTVGQACNEFALRYRRPRGMYFSADDRGHMAASEYYVGVVLGFGCTNFLAYLNRMFFIQFIKSNVSSGVQLAATCSACHCGYGW